MQTAGRTVLFSGVTVAVALAALIVMPQRFLHSIGAAGAAVGLLSALMAVLVLPALLALLGTRVNALSIRKGPAPADASGGWYRLAKAVMRRPLVVAVGCSLLLLATASPLLHTDLTGPSAEAAPPSRPSYAVNAYIDADYPRGVAFPVTVTVTGGASRRQLALLHRRLDRIAGLDDGTPFIRASPTAAYANLTPAHPALDDRVQHAVDAIRAHRGERPRCAGDSQGSTRTEVDAGGPLVPSAARRMTLSA